MSVLSDRVVHTIIAPRAVGAACVVAAFGLLGGVTARTAAQTPKKPTAARPAKAVAVKTPPAPVADDATPLTEEQRIVHALNRMGFGPRPGDVAKVKALGLSRYVEQQLHPEKIADAALDAKLAPLNLIQLSNADLAQLYYERLKKTPKLLQAKQAADRAEDEAMKAGADPREAKRKAYASLTPEQREAARGLMETQQTIRAAGAQLVYDKAIRAVESERQLQEVVVDFWSNHFNIDMSKGSCAVYKVADERDVVRKHAFGKFRDMLGASAKSPAMLFYLDNAQSSAEQTMNPRQARRMRQVQQAAQSGDMRAQQMMQFAGRRKGGLNENYAREIMELHTLGVDGGYTQKDVTEVARCLTGWTIDRRTGGFTFTPARHDNGEKTVMGRKIAPGGGMRDGETVLDMLASHPNTMRYVSTKLCRRFVADDPPKTLVDKCVATWKRTDGDLREIYRTIFTSPEFFSRAAYRQKIKSPFEYAVSSVRALGGTLDAPREGGLMRAQLAGGGERRLGGVGQRVLVGQVAVMGQQLYRYQAPTGWPEDSRKWVSSGALISRLNFALALSGGKLMDVRGISRLADGGENAPALVSRLADTLLHGEVTPSTRATLLKQAQTAPGKSDVAADTDTATRLVALVLGSPEFQRR